MEANGKLGGMIDEKLRPLTQKVERGIDLLAGGKPRAAIKQLNGALASAAERKIGLPAALLVTIYMNLGYAFADLNEPKKLLAQYERARWLLEKDEAKIQELGEEIGTAVVVFEGEENREALASLYQALGLAHDSLGAHELGISYFNQAIDIFMELGNLAGYGETWEMMLNAAVAQQDWPLVAQSAHQVLNVKLQTNDRAGEVAVRKQLAQAHLQQGDYKQMAAEWEQVVTLSRQFNLPNLEQDLALLPKFRQLAAQSR